MFSSINFQERNGSNIGLASGTLHKRLIQYFFSLANAGFQTFINFLETTTEVGWPIQFYTNILHVRHRQDWIIQALRERNIWPNLTKSCWSGGSELNRAWHQVRYPGSRVMACAKDFPLCFFPQVMILWPHSWRVNVEGALATARAWLTGRVARGAVGGAAFANIAMWGGSRTSSGWKPWSIMKFSSSNSANVHSTLAAMDPVGVRVTVTGGLILDVGAGPVLVVLEVARGGDVVIPEGTLAVISRSRRWPCSWIRFSNKLRWFWSSVITCESCWLVSGLSNELISVSTLGCSSWLTMTCSSRVSSWMVASAMDLREATKAGTLHKLGHTRSQLGWALGVVSSYGNTRNMLWNLGLHVIYVLWTPIIKFPLMINFPNIGMKLFFMKRLVMVRTWVTQRSNIQEI